MDYAAAVVICVGTALTSGDESSAIASVCI